VAALPHSYLPEMTQEGFAMKCPVDGAALVMTERHGVEIDYCPQCRGVWLDRGELDKIIDKATPAVALPEPGRPAMPDPRMAPPPPAYDERRRFDERRPGDERRRDDNDRPRHDDDRRRDDDDPHKKKKRRGLLDDIFDF
jgi:Zn-finger nucleic acid-binding protein